MKTSPSVTRFVLVGSLVAGLFHAKENARAEDRNWISSDGSWGDKTKWNSVGFPPQQSVPSPGDNAQFFPAATPFTVTVSGNTIQNVQFIPTSSVLDLTFSLAGTFTVTNTLNAAVIGTLRFSGGSTASIGTLNADTLAIGAGTTVQTSSAVASALNLTTGTFQATTLRLGDHGAITAGGTLTTTNSTLTFTGFGPFLVNGSTWDNSAGKFSSVSGQLALSNGGQLKSASGDLSSSGKVTVDASTSWQNTGDLTLHSGGELDVVHGGTVTIGGNLLLTHSATEGGGVVFLNYPDTGGASRLDVSGRVDAGLGSFFVAAGATLTSVGVVTRDSTGIEVRGTWTNMGNFVVGESGGGGVFGPNDLQVKSGGLLTTSGDLIIGQQGAQNSFGVGGVGTATTATNVNGVLAQNAGSRTTASVSGAQALWTNTGTLTVADAGAANLFIQNGGTVTSLAATVGKQGGSNGLVTLSDNGKWTVNGNLVIGAATNSTGSVEVDLGSTLKVTGPTLTLGRDAGSGGTLTLGGYGRPTFLDFAGTLQVGLAGNGTLNVIAGFQLDQGAKSLVLGAQATSIGTLHVSDAGSVFKSTDLTLGALGEGILKIEKQGFVETTGQAVLGEMDGGSGMAIITGTGSKWQVDGSLVIGKIGTLLLTTASHVTVSAGATLAVNGPFLTIGQETHSEGTLTLDGVGSKFTGSATTALEIGRFGAGTLELLNGAALNIASVTLGAQDGGYGAVKVDGKASGQPSTFVSLGSITVGGVAHSIGELDITNGGHVSSTGKAIIGRAADSNGVVMLTGTGSDWNLVAGGSGAAGDLTIGQSGKGDLTVGSQATLTTGALVLGQNARSDGTLSILRGSGATAAKVTVDGLLTVGDSGKGKVTVSDGSQLVTKNEATLGKQAGSDGTVRLLGAGTTWNLSGKNLTVGQSGTGKLELRDQARLMDTAALVAVGLLQSSAGSVVVDGAGSLLQIKTLGLGADGDGTLSISNGGKVIADGLVTGSAGGSGSVEVGGSGSTLEIKDLSLGKASSPLSSGFAIFNGGQATISGLGGNSTITVAIADEPADPIAPDVSVSGSGSLLTVAATTLRIGNDAQRGSMAVGGGGKVSAVNLSIGDGSRVVVSGNSNLTTTGRLEIGTFGNNGNGTLEVSDSSQVVAPGVLVTGQLNVRGQGTTLTANGGALDVESGLLVGRGSVAVSGGGKVIASGTLSVGVFGQSSVTVAGAGTELRSADATVGGGGSGSLATSDGGHVAIGSSVTVRANGTLSTAASGSVDIGPGLFDQAPAGQIRVGALGTLKVNGAVTGTVFNFGGTVGGSGTINGQVINSGTVAPGNSPGTLHVVGDFTQLSTGTLQMQIAGTGAGQFDVLDATGKLTLGGMLELDFLSGFLPQNSDTFHLLNFGTLAGAFDQITINGIASGWLYTLAANGSTFDLISQSNAQAGGGGPPPTDFLVPTGPTVVVTGNSDVGATQKIIFQGGTLEATANLSLGNQVNLPQDGTFLADPGTSSTLSGIVSGSGVLTKSGAGTLALTSQNLYTGGTVLRSGTLAVGNSSALGTGALSVTGAATLRSGAAVTLANNIDLQAPLTADTPVFHLTLSGVISGASNLIKTGAATLTLSGANTYRAGTAINGGVLAISSDANLGNAGGPLTFNGGTLQTLAAITSTRAITLNGTGGIFDSLGYDSRIDGAITGTGGLTKVGTGTVTLTGANTYTGDTNVSGGVLSVNGSIASANTIVNPGGTLGGTGMMSGAVMNSGIVKPGNSPGTLTIAGNYTQFANGTLQIAVAGAMAGQYSVLAVGGHASLAGALQVVQYGAATLKPGDTLKILTAVGGVSGTFSTAVNPFATGALLGMNVIYEANDVLLTFTQNTVTQALAAVSPFTPVTPNQTAVARALDKVLADPRAAQVINFLNSEPLGRIPGDLDRLGPADLTAIFHLATSLANIQTANVQRRLEEIRSDGASDIKVPGGSVTDGRGVRGPKGAPAQSVAPAEDPRWGMWFTGSGEFTNVGSTTNAAGFSLDSGGVTAGVDYRFTDKFAAGISLGYMNTTASLANNGKIDVNGGRIGAYATWFDRGLHLDASVTGGINGYATRRTAPNTTSSIASPQGTEVNLLFAAGYDWKWKGLTIGPTASFQYTNMQLNGITETGTFAPLNVQTKTADSARTALGFHATYDAKIGRAILRPEVRAAWQHEFGDTSYSLTSSFATLGGAPFTVRGPETGRDSLLVGAGFSIQWNERFSTYAYYDGELLRTNYSSNNVSVGFRWKF